jgi:putative glutamine transport system substrate-binding protein
MKFFMIAGILAVCNFSVFSQFTGDTYASAKSKGSATWVLTYAEAPGFASKKDGQMTGITVDLMKRFEKYVEDKTNIQVTMEFKANDANNFTRSLQDVKGSQGGVFGLSNTTITAERKKSFQFSPAYITNIGMIITHSSVATVNNKEEFAQKFNGLTAVTVKNSTNEQKILELKKMYLPSLKIEYVNSFSEALKIVANDPSKFTDLDFTYYLSAVQAKMSVKRHPGGDETTEQFGIIMPRSNDWAPLLSDFMQQEFLNSVEYKKIIAENLGSHAMKYLEAL